MLDKVIQHLNSNRERWLRELFELLRIPSISTLADHRPHVMSAAEYVANALRSLGMDEVIIETGKGTEQPLVRAQRLRASGKPTLLLYAHFDVQPVDPLALWLSPPFAPEIRDGNIYARGAADDKGQLWILIAALAAFMEIHGELPVNIKMLIEGEEESSGQHIARVVVEEAPTWLADVDAVLVLDNSMFAPGLPSISAGLRGLICAEVNCRGTKGDLHSGQYGGAAPNAAQGLNKVLAALHTPTGRVRIPRFYQNVQKPSKRELASWAALPFDETAYTRDELGARALIGDSRYSVQHRCWALPTVEINGQISGFTGDGFKTVIPATAHAKVSLRLVPGMDPKETAQAFVDFVRKVTPKYVTTEVKILSADAAIALDLENHPIQTLARAYEETFGAKTAYIRSGGSIPIAATFKTALGKPVACTGFTLTKCNEHAPNEFMPVSNFYQGMEAIARFFWHLGN